MSRILRNLYYKTNKALTTSTNKIFSAGQFNLTWYSTEAKAISVQHITSLLRKKFPNANDIKVEDVSGGCGAMFEVFVESADFKGLSIVKQHQAVTNTIKDEMKQIHGIRIQTKVP